MFNGSLSDGVTTIALYDAPTEYRNVASQGTPLVNLISSATGLPLGRANSMAQPLHEAAHAWVLVLRSDLDKLILDNAMSLTFVSDSPVVIKMPWKNLFLCREPQVVIPSASLGDPDGVCLIELADARWLCKNALYSVPVPVNTQYNVSAPTYRGTDTTAGVQGPGEYYEDSLNAGELWTWAEMIGDLWGLMPALGDFPDLPITPDGLPEGWMFEGSAWDALKQVLWRIGCAIDADLTEDEGEQFSIVQIGADDPEVSAALTAAEAKNRKIHDGELEVLPQLLPFGVQLLFRRQDQYYGNEKTTPRDSTQWQTNSVYSINVDGDGTGQEGVYHPLWDDMPAIFAPDGTLTNAAALTTRADERAADYFRMMGGEGGTRLWKRYSGLLDLTPGSSLKGVRWTADNRGVWTEVVRHPLILGLGDGSDWKVNEDASALQSPDFRPTWPLYPQAAQVGQLLTGLLQFSGTYDSIVDIGNSTTQAFDDGPPICMVDLRNAVPDQSATPPATLADPVLLAHDRYNMTRIGPRLCGNYYICLTPGAGNALTSSSWGIALPDQLVLQWLDATSFNVGDVALSSGVFWIANLANQSIKPGTQADILSGTWSLWTLSDYVPAAYVPAYSQGAAVTGSLGGTYVVTGATGQSQDPDVDPTGYTKVTSGPTLFVEGQSSVPGTDVTDSSGNEWIWPGPGTTTTDPTAANGWVEVTGSAGAPAAFVEGAYQTGAIVNDADGNPWLLITGPDNGPPAAPNWIPLPTLNANGVGYDPTVTYAEGDYTLGSLTGPVLRDAYTFRSDSPVEKCPCSGTTTTTGSGTTTTTGGGTTGGGGGGGGGYGSGGSCFCPSLGPQPATICLAITVPPNDIYGVPAGTYYIPMSIVTVPNSGVSPTQGNQCSYVWTTLTDFYFPWPDPADFDQVLIPAGAIADLECGQGISPNTFQLLMIIAYSDPAYLGTLSQGGTLQAVSLYAQQQPIVSPTMNSPLWITGANIVPSPNPPENWTVNISPGGCGGATLPISLKSSGLPSIDPRGVQTLAIGAPQLNNTGSITIATEGTSTTAGNNTVTLDNGGVAGTPSASTATTVTFNVTTAPTTTPPFTLHATLSVTDGTNTALSGTKAPIVNVLANPTVSVTTTSIGSNAKAVIITGTGFHTTPAGNLVTFSSGTGHVTAASTTSLTVQFDTAPSAGTLNATVNSFGGDSNTAQVADVSGSSGPLVTLGSGIFPAASATLIILGGGFNATPANNAITFSSGAVGTAGAGSTTSALVVTLTTPPTSGPLFARITNTGSSITSGAPVQVAQAQAGPVITPVITSLALPLTTFTILGTDLNQRGQTTTVDLSSGSATVMSASPGSVTARIVTQPDLGALHARVNVSGVGASTWIEVANITPGPTPTIDVNIKNLSKATTRIVLTGTGFDPIKGNTTVVFSNSASPVTGAVVSVNKSGTSLTVSAPGGITNTGRLDAKVSTRYGGASTTIQAATVVSGSTPTITGPGATTSWSSGLLTITGTGFDATTPANNIVSLTSGTAVVIASTSATLTAVLRGVALGLLKATVIVNGVKSVTPQTIVTVASTLDPVVTPLATSIPPTTTSVIIAGANFDPNFANDTVALSGTSSPTGGAVTAATPTEVTVTGITFGGGGTFLADISTTVGSSGAVQVRNVTLGLATTLAAGGSPPNSVTSTPGVINNIGSSNVITVASNAGMLGGMILTIVSGGVTWTAQIASISGTNISVSVLSITGGAAGSPTFIGDAVTY